jgi:3D (Asp-Asp-Asp) domain-containing protein
VAADLRVHPMGTRLAIEGVGERVVQDIGGMVHGRHLDIFVASCEEAWEWGRRWRVVQKVQE